MSLAILAYWKEIALGVILLAVSILFAHDRIVSAKLDKEKVIAAQLQSNNDDLASKLDAQTAAVNKLHLESDSYLAQSRAAVQSASDLRKAGEVDRERIQALQVPSTCPEALGYLVRYWRLPSSAAAAMAAPKP